MTRRVIRLPSDGRRFFEVVSYGRAGPQLPGRFSRAQIDQISRTVRRIPEVMVKVTGGGTRRGAVAAHFAYISRQGALEIETDDGERIGRREEQKRLLDDWHLELTAGQYRRQVDGGPARRPTKLVHNIVLSMPAPTPADKVLAAARQFARQKFARHRYAMVLHTDQQHPHVHLVVKAENELGRRMHIDKQLLRDWREHFAELMRDRMIGIATELSRTGTVEDPARSRLVETRKSLVSAWIQGTRSGLCRSSERWTEDQRNLFVNRLACGSILGVREVSQLSQRPSV